MHSRGAHSESRGEQLRRPALRAPVNALGCDEAWGLALRLSIFIQEQEDDGALEVWNRHCA